MENHKKRTMTDSRTKVRTWCSNKGEHGILSASESSHYCIIGTFQCRVPLWRDPGVFHKRFPSWRSFRRSNSADLKSPPSLTRVSARGSSLDRISFSRWVFSRSSICQTGPWSLWYDLVLSYFKICYIPPLIVDKSCVYLLVNWTKKFFDHGKSLDQTRNFFIITWRGR